VKVRPTRPERYKKETSLVANPDFFALAVFACFRVFGPVDLEGLWLAFSPSVLGFPRTLGSSASRLPDDSEFSSSGGSSLALRRRLSVFLLTRRPPTRVSCRPWATLGEHLAMCLRPYSICGRGNPIFRLLSKASHRFYLTSRRSRSEGLATLSAVSSFHALGSLFQPPTLMGFSLQSFSPAGWSGSDFSLPSPPSRFSTRPIGLVPAPRRLTPTWPAAPLIATRMVSPGRGLTALLGLLTFRALPPLDRNRASLPALTLPFFDSHDLSIAEARNPRVCSSSGLALSLRRGCRPVWPFPPIASRRPLERKPAADYFFISKGLQLLRAGSVFS